MNIHKKLDHGGELVIKSEGDEISVSIFDRNGKQIAGTYAETGDEVLAAVMLVGKIWRDHHGNKNDTRLGHQTVPPESEE